MLTTSFGKVLVCVHSNNGTHFSMQEVTLTEALKIHSQNIRMMQLYLHSFYDYIYLANNILQTDHVHFCFYLQITLFPIYLKFEENILSCL